MATVLIPAVVAAWMLKLKRNAGAGHRFRPPTMIDKVADHLLRLNFAPCRIGRTSSMGLIDRFRPDTFISPV